MNNDDKAFILENIEKDTSKLLFKYHKDNNKRFLINQIGKRQKIKKKLPEFFDNIDFIFPQNSKAIEQCSSEISAKIKASKFSGENFLDLTGGLGIDSFYFSKNFNSIFYNELDISLYNLAKINFPNFIHSNLSAEEFFKESEIKFDLIYIDPDRRNTENKKLSKLTDLSPNILNILKYIKAKNILIKLSPMFEISEFEKHFENYEVWIISINDEIKEILLYLNKKNRKKIKLLIQNKELIEKDFEFNKLNVSLSDEVNDYLYEPFSAVLKANLQDTIANEYQLTKQNSNSHIYFSNEINQNYLGNIYKLKYTLKYNKKDFFENNIEGGIIKIKNFPDSLSKIKKDINIKENNSQYLFFTRDYNNKLVCYVCKKMK